MYMKYKLKEIKVGKSIYLICSTEKIEVLVFKKIINSQSRVGKAQFSDVWTFKKELQLFLHSRSPYFPSIRTVRHPTFGTPSSFSV